MAFDLLTPQRCAGHAACMGEIRNIYKFLVGNTRGKRPLGRPRLRWEDYIKVDQEIGYYSADWIHVVQDSDQWRALMKT